MAGVLDAMAPYVQKLITDMAQEEVSMLLGVSGEITRLEDNMEGIKAFLTDAERRRLTDESVRRWVRKLKDAMYDATDIVDLCQLETDKRRGSTEERREDNQLPYCQPLLMCLTCGSIEMMQDFFQRLLFCMRNPVFAHEIGSRIRDLNQRLDGIHKEADKYNSNINLGSYPEPRMLNYAERSTQKMTSEIDESAIVGEKIEQDTRELAQLLIKGGLHDIRVVSIVGTGGMGKTTLAQKIFNEVTIQEHFKVKVWLSITQHFDEIELLKTAIEHAGGVHGGTQDKTLLSQSSVPLPLTRPSPFTLSQHAIVPRRPVTARHPAPTRPACEAPARRPAPSISRPAPLRCSTPPRPDAPPLLPLPPHPVAAPPRLDPAPPS